MIWEKSEVKPEEIRELCEKYGVDRLLASILIRRGITKPEDIKFYLESDPRYLHNPFLFTSMEDAVDRLQMAAEEGEKVLVFGDKDVDGVTSSVILYESLKELLELELSLRVPTGDDSYGLSVNVVEEAYKSDISLILTVDCGISAYEAIDKANEYGIDVIVLDHHNPREGALPKASVIINPKLEDSGYPFDGLAAVGVVSKLIWALCFSRIDSVYKSRLCFLHGEEDGDTINFSALKLYNHVTEARIDLSFSEDKQDDVVKLVDFIKGEQIIVYGASKQKALFSRLIGSADLHVLDIQPEIERVLTGIAGHSFETLLRHSKMRLYSKESFTGIDLLKNLFITYIERRYEDKFNPFIHSLDLVALGTIADLMPLRGENRILVKKGLDILGRTRRDGLQALMLKQNLMGKDISSKDISWGLAPIINSAGRMKQADIAVDLLLGLDPDMRNKNALKILELNKERRSISESIWVNLYSDFHDSFEEFGKKILVHYDESITKGVTGIIAARALSSFGVPSIIIAKDAGSLSGSIRSLGNLDINALFKGCSDILTEWGGHNCAAGFKLKVENLKKLKDRIRQISKNREIITEVTNRTDKLLLDAYLPSDYLSPEIMKINDIFEPFGEGNSHLNFATKGVKILDINFMGKVEKKHLKMLIEIGKFKWPAIYWNGAERVGRDFTKGDVVDVAYRVERNFYGGSETLQLNILDIIK